MSCMSVIWLLKGLPCTSSTSYHVFQVYQDMTVTLLVTAIVSYESKIIKNRLCVFDRGENLL